MLGEIFVLLNLEKWLSVKVSQPCGSQDQKQRKPGEDRLTPKDQTVILQRLLNSGHFKKAFARNVFFSERQLLITLYKIATTYSHQPLSFHPGLIFPDTFLHLTLYMVEF